ncbi:ParB/RepB/Spo0J family partition protein [Enemella evansiae]|uniref:ParB/RepB/Spo0J family partition protein n=1 Tax=Enemella evansiae TaxID=2016499 RepID=UPI000B96785C|nr:ParB/RepB/Spo0J family partition protein [Enemella evansiae]OYO02498.1 chromosome partitioning protein ParB [Enemella evansiae]OYO12150.1 chromosome partitioning protein ParB [Enemella evansiae]
MNQQQRRSGLGRGLGQLIQNTDPATTRPHRPVDGVIDSQKSSRRMPEGSWFAEVPIEAITPNPKQPRTEFDEDDLTELTESIKEVGLLQPVVVRPLGKGPDGEQFELVMGERRWRASQAAGRSTIPAIVRPTEEHALLRDALLENLHRANLNPLEEANAYQQLLDDFGCTQEELSARIKRSRPQISNTIRLLRLPASVQRRVAAGVLSAGHARALLGLDDQLAQERLAQRIVAEGLSVRATEEIVTLGETGSEPRTPRAPKERPERAVELSDQLCDHFDTRARVDMGRSKGKIVIEFASPEDLERIIALMRLGDQG